MLQQFGIISIVIAFIWGLNPVESNNVVTFNGQSSVYEVERMLGGDPVSHELNPSIKGYSAAKGAELFHTGYTMDPYGRRTKKQSRHYVCTSCHNVVKEDPDLSKPNPEDRLTYASKKGIPFLQGTSLYGVVNRRQFYNGDYKEKYGPETVEKVKHDLRESIQLCAVGCAQGRSLDNWEKESILAYFWSLQLKMEDLDLTDNQSSLINNALSNKGDSKAALKAIKRKYLQAAPATFSPLPENYKKGYAKEGNVERGGLIYEMSCLHCHQDGRYSYYHLDESKLSTNHLLKHFRKKNSPYNAYNLIRKGTLPVSGDKAYMPQYPEERMSDQQVEDLRAYLKFKSKGS